MPSLSGCLLIAAAASFVTGCVVTAETGAETAASTAPQGGGAGAVPVARKVVRSADGSLRVPYIGGAFVTYNREMPIEIEQAIAGLPTDRPVIVWAGR